MRKNDLGLSRSEYKRLLHVRRHMINRCYDPESENYKYYGERGICVCNEWLEHPYLFVAFAVNNGWEPGLTIDRTDNNGNYEPCNCRFITIKEQMRNKRNNINLTVNGATKCLWDWCQELGINFDAARSRYHRNGTKGTSYVLQIGGAGK